MDIISAKSGDVIRRRNVRSGAKGVCDGLDIPANGRDEELCTLVSTKIHRPEIF